MLIHDIVDGDDDFVFASIDLMGTTTAPFVYQDIFGALRASFESLTTTVFNVTVVNTNNDDFGIYAGEGIPDIYQVNTFGEQNPAGVGSADPDLDMQDNYFEYVAGLDPLSAVSYFIMSVELSTRPIIKTSSSVHSCPIARTRFCSQQTSY